MESSTQWTLVWTSLGDSEGQGSLAYCYPWSCKELDMTDWKQQSFQAVLNTDLSSQHLNYRKAQWALARPSLVTHFSLNAQPPRGRSGCKIEVSFPAQAATTCIPHSALILLYVYLFMCRKSPVYTVVHSNGTFISPICSKVHQSEPRYPTNTVSYRVLLRNVLW